MATINVKDSAGSTVAIEKPNANGRAVAASSRPVALSTEDKASLDAITTAIGGIAAGGDATAANQDEQTALLTSIDASLGTSLAVTGDFYPTTQPVSGTVGISGTVPVSGTFWQATQPVSGPLTDTQLRATAVPVSGTFWQATQPVSGSVSITGSVGVTGTFWQATQPVSLAALPALVAGSAIIGKVGIDQTTDGTTNKANIDASLKSGTATRTTVASAVASATILASNAARKGATIFNSDANALLLDLSGGTAAATRCQVRLTQYQSYEVGSGFTGAITGIWEADGSGIADVVEFT